MSLVGRFRKAIGLSALHDPLVADLQKALSSDRVLQDHEDRLLHSKDESVFEGGIAGPVCFPLTTEEVQSIMKIAQQYDRAVVPRGAGSGLAGGAIPLGAPIVVALTKMNNIIVRLGILFKI